MKTTTPKRNTNINVIIANFKTVQSISESHFNFFRYCKGTESSSSWNSSGDEDDESLSIGVTKKSNVTTPKSNILRIIDEEKQQLNETKESNKSEFFLSKNEVTIISF